MSQRKSKSDFFHFGIIKSIGCNVVGSSTLLKIVLILTLGNLRLWLAELTLKKCNYISQTFQVRMKLD